MQRGFSLVETLVATSLLAGTLVALAQFVGAAVQTGAAGSARAATTLMAIQKMEQIRALPWDVLAAMPAEMTEYLDAAGDERCPGASAPCGDAVYVRRSLTSFAPFSAGVLITEVEVSLTGRGHGKTTFVTAKARMTP
jgi:prepilin-type N-terminal cleavage/methylation domain-containing protein